MQTYIFGFDSAHPSECAQELRSKGISAVIVGDVSDEAAAALEREGIDLYLCYSAHGLGGIPSSELHEAQNTQGQPQRWFSSGCPNDSGLAERHMQQVLEKASKHPSVRGIFVDGARFASFASAEGCEAFFTCFCPRCMNRMESMGMDARGIRSAAARILDTRRILSEDVSSLRSWFQFRESCAANYFSRFTEKVHALRRDLLAGAFVFAPSLAGFVGQTATACRSLDVVAPMLYRAYPHAEGPACLGHEWAGLKRLFGDDSEIFARLASPIFPNENAEALLQYGFEPAHIGTEVAMARAGLGAAQKLCPILQVEDDRLAESLQYARVNGADAVGLFAYGQAPINL